MPQFHLFTDVTQFYRETIDLLRPQEERYAVLLGNLIIGKEGKDNRGWRDPKNWFMATVTENDSIVLIALMTPPHNLTLFEAAQNDDALTCLVHALRTRKIPVPGVLAEKTLAERFADTFAPQAKRAQKLLRVYALREVNPNVSLHGDFRRLRESDFAFLPYWYAHFRADCYGDFPKLSATDADGMDTLLAMGNDFILEADGIPVTTARVSRAMFTSCCISMVYTPPYFRGRGYASSCVAQLCMEILRRGYPKCVLYADLDNPTSNSIYQKIGFHPVCDVLELVFVCAPS